MKLKVDFMELCDKFDTKFQETERSFSASFGSVSVVSNRDIPPEYGLVTYDQNRTITVS